jgi:hypothetical protein
MSISYIENLFSETELANINQMIDDSKMNVDDERLGRTLILELNFPENIRQKITKICGDILGTEVFFTHGAYAEYSNVYGNPNLPPHFDGDNNILFVDYQLESNTSWDLGIDVKSYPLQDNSALIFDTNKHVHWRPRKNFKDGEYVKMLFFRVCDLKNPVDNSHLNYSQDHHIFEEARKFRDSLS